MASDFTLTANENRAKGFRSSGKPGAGKGWQERGQEFPVAAQ